MEQQAEPVKGVGESKNDGESAWLHLRRASVYSLQGLVAAFRHELAFRIEIVAFALLLPVIALLPVELLFKAMVVGSMLLVLVVELLNSAIEWVVDYISLDRHPFAKRAKDMGSAAVLIANLNAALMWALALHQWLA